jgi:hypothetical protein
MTVAIPSQVAERTNRFSNFRPFISLDSNSLLILVSSETPLSANRRQVSFHIRLDKDFMQNNEDDRRCQCVFFEANKTP